jgi:hypothetical protein
VNFKLDCKPKELLQEILELGLCGVFPNITIAPSIFVTLPASVASGKRTLSVLKRVKNYYRSAMEQDRLNGFNINCDFTKTRGNYKVLRYSLYCTRMRISTCEMLTKATQ